MKNEKQEVIKTVGRFLDTYTKKDIEGCMGFIANKTPFLMLGTNDDEVLTDPSGLREAFQKDFSIMTDINFGKYRNQYVDANENLASVIIELPISYKSDGQRTLKLFRYALILTKENDRWKVCAGMASVPFKSGTYSF